MLKEPKIGNLAEKTQACLNVCFNCHTTFQTTAKIILNSLLQSIQTF